MNKIIVYFFGLLFIIFNLTSFSLVDTTLASSSVLYVYPNGDSNFTSIQDAIENAVEGDTVFVYSGYYYENVIVDKSINIVGEDELNTTIDGSNYDVLYINTDNVMISGFTIKNGLNGINIVNSSQCIITENTITDSENGIYIDNLSFDNKIYLNNFIINNNHAYDSSINSWHFLNKGNYWDDYTGYDKNNNGIGDIPYNISGGNRQDRFPLINPITELPAADFSFSPSNPFTVDVIEFTDESEDLDGYIVNWSWDFGDGNISFEQNPNYSYPDDGIYNITLEIVDNYGASIESIKQITVLNTIPSVNFSYKPNNPTDLQNVHLMIYHMIMMVK